MAELTETTFDGNYNAGDAVLYDYRLFHRGMPNNLDIIRPVLQVKWYVEKENYGEEKIAQSRDSIAVFFLRPQIHYQHLIIAITMTIIIRFICMFSKIRSFESVSSYTSREIKKRRSFRGLKYCTYLSRIY